MAMEDVEKKLDLILDTLRTLAPEVLPPGMYKVRIRSIEERKSIAREIKYWQYKFEYELFPGRFVWGNFVESRRPHIRTIGTQCTVFVIRSEYGERLHNIVDEVFDD